MNQTPQQHGLMSQAIAYILLVEDVPRAAQALTALAADIFPGCRVWHAASLHDARLVVADAARVDLALIDLGLPDGDGRSLIPLLAQRHPAALRIVSTIFADDEHLLPALRAGAQGYILKDEPLPRLRRALEGIVCGEPPLSAAIARRILSFAGEHAPTETTHDGIPLSPREREILTLVAKGLKLQEVADHLQITRHTAAHHIKSIYRKLGISSRAEATLAAARMGLVTSDAQ